MEEEEQEEFSFDDFSWESYRPMTYEERLHYGFAMLNGDDNEEGVLRMREDF